jgi:hypothetical protein
MIRCSLCPVCSREPQFVLAGAVQAFCGNDECKVICWNPSESLAENLKGLEGQAADD